MGSKFKEKMNVTRSDAVHRIESLIKELERGTVKLGDKTFEIPADVRLEIEAKGGELEIELKWPLKQEKQDEKEDEALPEEPPIPLLPQM